MRVRSFASLLIVVSILFPQAVVAQASVGIGTALLKPAMAIEAGKHQVLEPVVVINDGDQTGEFELSVTFNETQQEHKPQAKWLEFSEQKFVLEPGQLKQVTVTLRLPPDAQTGEYFAYIEAAVHSSGTKGSARVSAVSASKLSFKVATATLQAREAATDVVAEILPQKPLWPTASRPTAQKNSKLSDLLRSTTLANITSKSSFINYGLER